MHRPTKTHSLRYSTALAGGLALALSFKPWPANALPQGGQVTGGQADITVNGSALTVSQSSARAVLDWSSFDVAGGEKVQFDQPSSTAIALNRIHDIKPSHIDGSLTANGQVWLINRHGVVFGQNAQVNVGGLLATTSDIDNDRFMAGDYRFDQPGEADGAIRNAGTIRVAPGGLAAFAAAEVTNSGLIEAHLGKVQLASGDTFAIDLHGDGLINLQASEAITEQLVSHSGVIIADGGTVLLTTADAEKAISSLVNVEGVIRANSIDEVNGEVVLLAGGDNGKVVNSGTIMARGDDAGERGGAVRMAAKTIEQKGAIRVDAQADAGKVEIVAAESYTETADAVISAASAEAAGGEVNLQGYRIEREGVIMAAGTTQGGSVEIDFTDQYKDRAGAFIEASATQGDGGSIHIEGGDDASLYSEGTYLAGGVNFGGTINLLSGEKVVLVGAQLSVTGGSGGGIVRIGGDFQGSGGFRRSRFTMLDHNTLVYADATDDGDGGTVIVWADQATGFYGSISAQGGANGGDGGLVETSGKIYLDARGNVNTLAPHGATGLWLLDPTDITISSAADTGTMTWTGTQFEDTTTATSNLNVTTLQNQLASTNVLVTTASGLGGTGNITVQNAVTWSSGNSLTLFADNDITVSANITYTGAGASLRLQADNDIIMNTSADITATGAGGLTITLNSNRDGAGTGAIVMGSGTSLVSNGGDITLGGGNDPAATAAVGTSSNIDGLNIAGDINAGGGNISLRGTGGANIGGSFNNGVYVNGGMISTTGAGAITVVGQGGGSTGGSVNHGIRISGNFATQHGDISLTGTSVRQNGGTDLGIFFVGGTIQSTGSASISLIGHGNASTSDAHGIVLGGNSVPAPNAASIISHDGDIVITGDSTGATGHGIGIGLYDTGFSAYTTGAGNITFTGTGIGGLSDIAMLGAIPAVVGNGLETGDVTLNANTLNLSNTTFQTSGNVWFKPRTAGTTLGVGAGAGTLNLSNALLNNITAGSITIGDATNTGTMEINTPAALAESITFITRNGADITLSGQINSSHNGNAIILASGDDIHNLAGAGVFNLTGGGRWLLYSQSPLEDTKGGLAGYAKRYNKSYASYGPGSVVESGNVWMYSIAPAITITADSKSRAFGSANPAFTYQVAGLIDGDTAASALTGNLTTSAKAGSPPGTYAIAQGTLADMLGYTIAGFNVGSLTVNYDSSSTASTWLNSVTATTRFAEERVAETAVRPSPGNKLAFSPSERLLRELMIYGPEAMPLLMLE